MDGVFFVEGQVLKHYGIPGMKKGYHKGVLWNRALVAKPEDYDRTDDAIRSDVKKRAAATNPYYDPNYVNTRGGNSTIKNFLNDLNEYGGLMSKDPYSSTRQEKKKDRMNELLYGTSYNLLKKWRR